MPITKQPKNHLFEGVWRDENYDYWYRYYDAAKKKSVVKKVPYKDRFFVPSDDSNTPFSTLVDNIPLEEVKRFPGKEVEHYKLRPDAQIRYDFSRGRGEYNPNPGIWWLDIETTAYNNIDVQKAEEEIVLIQILDRRYNTMFVISTGPDWKPSKVYIKEYKKRNFNVKYVRAKDEKDLFKKYFTLLQKTMPLLVFAWNGNGFDFPYMFKRAEKLGFDLSLFSPVRQKCEYKEIYHEAKGYYYYRFRTPGIHYIDYMEVYKKFTYEEKKSYSLDFIAKLHLKGNGKIEHSMYSTFDAFRTGDPKSYIMPPKEPVDKYEREMYHLQKEYRQNPSKELREEIREKAHELFVHYGVIDTWLLGAIDNKTRFTEILFMIVSQTGSTYDDVLGTVRIWANLIEIFCWESNQLLPPDNYDLDDIETTFMGGFVADPQKGVQNWVVSVDINSAYPNLSMRGFNMSPETYVPLEKYPKEIIETLQDLEIFDENCNHSEDEEKLFEIYNKAPERLERLSGLLEKYNYSMGIDGSLYRKDIEGVVPTLLAEFYARRKEFKKELGKYKKLAEEAKENGNTNEYEKWGSLVVIFDAKQMAIKILINSLFGALTSKYFRLFNLDIGKSITGNTRFYIHLLRRNVDSYLKRLTKRNINFSNYSDTDSLYFTVFPIVEKYIEKTGVTDRYKIAKMLDKFIEKKIQPVVEETNQELARLFNAYNPGVIKAERETIADKALFLQKKKYLLRALDIEGIVYHPPKLKKTGIDLVRSSTPEFVGEKLEESVDIILDGTEQGLRKWVEGVKKEIAKQPLDKICKTTGIGSLAYNLDKPTYKDGKKVAIPINSRAALVMNRWIEKKGLNRRYFPITTQDKVQLVFLKLPNPLNSDVIAFKDLELAESFREFIDYEKIWEKYFLKPLELMLEPLEWDVKRKVQSFEEEF